MNQQKIEDLFKDLKGLLDGIIKPRRIVGTGYTYPKSVASAWLRKEIHNLESPTCKVDHVCVTSSGKAYRTETMAMKSEVYQNLVKGTFKTITNSIVNDYGVMTAPGSDGYMIYVCLN